MRHDKEAGDRGTRRRDRGGITARVGRIQITIPPPTRKDADTIPFKTVGGEGEAGKTQIERPGKPAESGKGEKPGSKAAGGKDTLEATAADTDDEGERGRHGVENGERGGVVGQRGRQAANSHGVEKGEGGHNTSGLEINLVGYHQGVGGGIKLPGGTKTPVVERYPQGEETSGVTPKGDRFPGGDGLGRAGDENSPATQRTKGAKTAPGMSMDASRHGTAAQPRP